MLLRCSFIRSFLSAKRTMTESSGTAGGITGVMKTPSSSAIFTAVRHLFRSRTKSGIIGDWVWPMSKPRALNSAWA